MIVETILTLPSTHNCGSWLYHDHFQCPFLLCTPSWNVIFSAKIKFKKKEKKALIGVALCQSGWQASSICLGTQATLLMKVNSNVRVFSSLKVYHASLSYSENKTRLVCVCVCVRAWMRSPKTDGTHSKISWISELKLLQSGKGLFLPAS